MTLRDYPIAIIGAGPVGMAAAAHLVERNIPFLLFEAGNSVGANLLDWGHVRVFSSWRYNIDKAAERLLNANNWSRPDEEGLPTGKELVTQYLLPLSFHPRIEPYLNLSSKVISITRRGINKVRTSGRERVPFIISVNQEGKIRSYECSGVIDSSGTWQNPNPIGAGGVFATGETENQDKIAYRIPDILNKDKARYAGKKVLVIGGGHSAINSLLDLALLKEEYSTTELHWALQAETLSQIYGGKEDDALEARGALGIKIEHLVNSGQLHIHTPYFIHELISDSHSMTVKGYVRSDYEEIIGVEEIIANTGGRPDLSMLREVRVQVDASLESVPGLAELIDPNIHSCGTVRPHGELELRQPEPNFYVVGVKSYGRAPTFLMATGYEQVRSIAAYLDGDAEAARRVELDLPETGVCSTGGDEAAACCGVSHQQTKSKSAIQNSKTEIENINQNSIDMETQENVNNEVEVAESGCCGGAPASNEEACCKLDEEKKAEGEAGCGCNSSPAQTAAKASACCG